MGKVIYWDLCKKFKFDCTNKWHMHNPESVMENETQNVLWNFEIQTNPLTSTRWPDRITVNIKKRNSRVVDFTVTVDHRLKLNPKGICPKVDVIARLEFEPAYYDFAVYCFNHYTTRTPHFEKSQLFKKKIFVTCNIIKFYIVFFMYVTITKNHSIRPCVAYWPLTEPLIRDFGDRVF